MGLLSLWYFTTTRCGLFLKLQEMHKMISVKVLFEQVNFFYLTAISIKLNANDVAKNRTVFGTISCFVSLIVLWQIAYRKSTEGIFSKSAEHNLYIFTQWKSLQCLWYVFCFCLHVWIIENIQCRAVIKIILEYRGVFFNDRWG